MNAPTPTLHIRAQFPAKFKPLLESDARFKVFYGGRAGSKSWQMARAIIIRGLKGNLRVLCTREVQSSMRESVYQLLKDQIKLLGVGPIAEGGSGHYKILESEIRGPGDTLIMFKGLSDPEAIKSLESCDICFVEEARVISKTSWLKLEPTIRKPGSQIWIAFNPELESDYLYELFVKNAPPPNSVVVKVTWRDNPFLSQESRNSMEHMRATDYDTYLWIWEGFCKVALDGAVYAKELRAAQNEHRICHFGTVKGKTIQTFWDLGRADLTAIWFVQLMGMENRLIRYHHENGQHISHYIELMKTLERDEGYIFGTVWLPHDAEEKRLSSRRTVRQQIEDAGYKVRITPKVSVSAGIDAARGIFPNCWFHEANAAEGINMLRKYRYGVDDDGVRSKNPIHDDSSNGADAFRYMGVALRDDTTKAKPKPKPRVSLPSGRQSWMGR